MLTMALFSIVSFAQGGKLADGIEPLPADAETPGSEYTLVFHDEFNEPDGTLPNTKVWRHCTRYPKVTWARFLSDSPKISVPMTKIQESTESNDIYLLQGAKMGTHESELPKGIYVLNGKKFVK